MSEQAFKVFYPNHDFVITKQVGKMRTGIIKTPHGEIKTPAFIFCATKAALKSATVAQAKEEKTQIILSNTYHLGLLGHEKIKELGGLQKAMGWNKPMLTDSGGYQVFAMNHGSVSGDIKGNRGRSWKPTLIGVDEKGATFRSYYDRRIIKMTPESSIQIQNNLGADLVVVFDECTSTGDDHEATRLSMERSHRWEKRSLDEFMRNNNGTQALYGIVQGGIHEDLRKDSCYFVNSQPFFAIAVGGCLGSTTEQMYRTVQFTMEHLDTRFKPVHLLGIGYLKDIWNGVLCGIDTFDCVHPTRIARTNMVLMQYKDLVNEQERKRNEVKITKSRFKSDPRVIDETCGCSTCRSGISRAYLKMISRIEPRAVVNYLTVHNIYFMNTFMEDIRRGINEDCMDEIKIKYFGPLHEDVDLDSDDVDLEEGDIGEISDKSCIPMCMNVSVMIFIACMFTIFLTIYFIR